MIGQLLTALFNLFIGLALGLIDLLDSIINPVLVSVFGSNFNAYIQPIGQFINLLSNVWGWVVDLSMLPDLVLTLVGLYFIFSLSYWLITHPIKLIVRIILDLF